MDEFELKVLLGAEMFYKGMRILKAGGIKPCVEVAEGIFTFEVIDEEGNRNILLKRVYPSEVIKDLYDCDCGSPLCEHYSAVFIFENLTDDIHITEQSVVDRIVERIDSLVSNIVSDPMYYKMTYADGTFIYHSREIEKEHISDVLADIFLHVTDPGTTLELLDMMFVRIRSLKYDNGGAEEALCMYEQEIRTTASYIDGPTMAKLLSSCDGLHEPWIKRYLGGRFHELEDAAYDINLRKGENGNYMRKRMLEKGDYDKLIRCRDYNVEDIIAVVEHLVLKDDLEQAKKYALRLLDIEKPELKVVNAMRSAGLVRETTPHYLRFFEGTGRLAFLETAFESDEVERDPYLDKVISHYRCNVGDSMMTMAFLVKYGRGDDVSEMLKSEDFRTKCNLPFIDFKGVWILFQQLRADDRMDDAAKTFRHVIESVLSANDHNNYEAVIEMVREMETDDGFERIALPHSTYMSELRVHTRNKRKFWAIYDGTYEKEVKKKKKTRKKKVTYTFTF